MRRPNHSVSHTLVIGQLRDSIEFLLIFDGTPPELRPKLRPELRRIWVLCYRS